ncbi:MAG: cohesin domain-containing protein [Oscillospiraceae bacterium]|nr:cohesin domain-containing protein [Oscillospiraceae bacterium]
MKRFISYIITLGLIIIVSSFVVSAMAASDDLTFTVGSATAQAGEDVLIPITVKNNSDALDIIALTVTFDSTRLEWQDLGTYVPGNSATHPWTHGGFIQFLANPGVLGTNSVTYYFMDQNGVYVESGTLVSLKLRVINDAPAGDAVITLSFTSVGDSRGPLNSSQYNNEAGKVTVGGSAQYLALSPNSWHPTAAGGSTTTSVMSNIAWSASSNAESWLTVSPASGSNNGSLTLTAQANTGTSRTGIITVTGDGFTQTVSVNQDGDGGSQDTLTFTVVSKKARSGEYVEVPIMVSNNPGFSSVRLNITLGSGLEWNYDPLDYTNNQSTWPFTGSSEVLAVTTARPTGSNFTSSYVSLMFPSNMENTYGNGVLVTLKLKISSTEDSVEIPITVDVNQCFDENDQDVPYKIISGSVSVYTFVYGDANGDGIVDDRDYQRLLQFLNGWIVEIHPGADANGDGVVDDRDYQRLLQYLNGWPVVLGPSSK